MSLLYALLRGTASTQKAVEATEDGRLLTEAASTRDSTGQPINPEACTHTYGYDASGLLVTDTATLGGVTWVKTYTYTSGNLTGETQWVRQ